MIRAISYSITNYTSHNLQTPSSSPQQPCQTRPYLPFSLSSFSLSQSPPRLPWKSRSTPLTFFPFFLKRFHGRFLKPWIRRLTFCRLSWVPLLLLPTTAWIGKGLAFIRILPGLNFIIKVAVNLVGVPFILRFIFCFNSFSHFWTLFPFDEFEWFRRFFCVGML